MKKILNILCVIALTIGISSCTKDDGEVRTPLETTELVGKWAKIEGSRNSGTVITDLDNLDTIKVLEFLVENRLKVSRGNFCGLKTDLGKNEEGAFEYYSVNNSDAGGTANRIKYEKCAQGIPVSIQGDILKIGYGNQSGAYEEYKKVVVSEIPGDPENPENPENPEEPTDPGTGGE